MSKTSVITVGAATRDVFIRSAAMEIVPSGDYVGTVDACFPLGAKIDIDDLVFETGGGATNAAVTFGRLGLGVQVLTAVGDDASGQEIIDALRSENVGTELIQVVPGRQTAYGLVLLSGSGERTVLVYRGAAESLDEKLIPWDTLKADWLYVTSMGGRIDLLERLFDHAAKHDCRIAWNPGNKEINYGLQDLSALIRQVDVFNLNLEEMMSLVGTSQHDPAALLQAAGKLPRLAAVITDGARGAYASDGQHAWFAPAMDVPRQNVTGAGDAFGSGFVASLLKKPDDIPTALATGIWNSSGVVQQMGAKKGLMHKYPTATELKKIGARVWR